MSIGVLAQAIEVLIELLFTTYEDNILTEICIVTKILLLGYHTVINSVPVPRPCLTIHQIHSFSTQPPSGNRKR